MFEKNSGLEKFMNNRGVALFRRKFLVPKYRKLRGGTLLCFRKIWYGKNYEKEGSSTIFVGNFLSHMPKKFVGEHFCVLEIVWFEKHMSNKWGGVLVFRRKFFFSQCREISWGPFKCFRNFGVSESFMHNRGYHYFPSEVFSLFLAKNFVGDPSPSDKFPGFGKTFP